MYNKFIGGKDGGQMAIRTPKKDPMWVFFLYDFFRYFVVKFASWAVCGRVHCLFRQKDVGVRVPRGPQNNTP